MRLIDGNLLAEAYPWATAFSKQLSEFRPTPFEGSHLLLGSDYGGSHRASRFRTYGFLVADADASPEWPTRCSRVREAFLSDGRRMSFKNLNDSRRRKALVPFLEASESFEGQVIVVAVTKELTYLTTNGNSLEIWKSLHGARAKWDPRSFEEMSRTAHFVSLFLLAWSSPHMHVSWITDDDDIVANSDRLEDAHQFAAQICGMYVPHQLGEFMMNTPAVAVQEPFFEDFLAIPDLAAGMVGEVLGVESLEGGIRSSGEQRQKPLSQKSEIIADWFWHRGGALRKQCILVNRVAKGMFSVGNLEMG